jgi:hypothetical protein
VPLATCNLRPEFEYVGSAPRKLGLALAFIVAGASGIAVFMADSGPDPDAMNAMALAPVEALSSAINATPAGTAKTETAEVAFVQRPAKAGGSKSPCQQNIAEKLVSDCTPGKAHKPRSILAINERPAIAAVPIGHRDSPAVLPPVPAAPVVAALPEDAETATPAEATPSAELTSPASPPAVAPTKIRERHRERAQRREREHREYASTPRHYSNRQAYRAGGYAGLW